MKVRIKREIVTMGEPNINPLVNAGHYVPPQDWNALISEPGTILIDTRNDYEVAVGSFAGAINPQTRTFREFPTGSVPSAIGCLAKARRRKWRILHGRYTLREIDRLSGGGGIG